MSLFQRDKDLYSFWKWYLFCHPYKI